MGRAATIIGGGIGGMATAIGLAAAGWDVEVLERAAGPETSGAALGLWPTAMGALQSLKIDQRVRAAATIQHSGTIRRPDGRPIATLDGEKLRRRTGEPVHLVSRRDLAEILVAAVPEGALTYGVEARVDQVPERDLVVVADGVFSASRTALFGDRYRARFTGDTAWRGAVDLVTDEAGETWGRGCRFGVTPYRDGRTNWYASIAAPERDRSPGEEVALLRRTFGDWHPPIPDILAALDETGVARHDLYDVWPPLPSYVAGSVALVGDAAHAMTPDLGRGACEALIDAVTLAGCLSDDPLGGLLAYDRRRRGRTQRLARTSYWMGRIAHARRFTGLRDLAVRAALKFGPPA